MHIEIMEASFNPWQILSEYKPCTSLQGVSQARVGEFGATAVFVGTMRDYNQGDEVTSMYLEHYPEMTHTHIEQTLEHATKNYAVGDVLVIHRVGKILPGEAIVLVAVWATHRRDAYVANRYIMEALKSKTAFWKRESLVDGKRWVKTNTAGE